jgi:hypothetical protein
MDKHPHIGINRWGFPEIVVWLYTTKLWRALAGVVFTPLCFAVILLMVHSQDAHPGQPPRKEQMPDMDGAWCDRVTRF